MTDLVGGVTGRARRLGDSIGAERSVTVRLPRLWELLASSSPDVARESGKRELLADALAELEAAGEIVSAKGPKNWDRVSHPPLPLFIRRMNKTPRGTGARDRLRYPWVPQLAWAASEPLTGPQREALMAVSAWLARHTVAPVPLPHRERSLEIFGYEKRLDELLGTPLFAPGRLTLELLHAYTVHPPFVWTPIAGATGDVLLVVENHNTFDSVRRALDDHTAAGHQSVVRYVAYGAGNAFEASVTYAADLVPRPSRILYFGDLDAEGLSIPTRASARALTAGLPRVEPHQRLYDLLLDLGRPQPAVGRSPATTWIGPNSERAALSLAGGHRLAQEWVTVEVLLTTTGWLDVDDLHLQVGRNSLRR